MNINLKDKKVLIFGASQGIGRGVLELFYQEGACLAASSRSQEKLDLINKDKNPKLLIIPGDLSLSGEGRKVTTLAIEKLKGLDILFINTGGPLKKNFTDLNMAEWNLALQNLWLSTIDIIQTALPSLSKSNHGRIILLASTTAKEPIAQMILSNSIRAGLLGLMKSLSTELAPKGITVNTLLPGFIETDRMRELGLNVHEVLKQIPMGRLGQVEDIAQLALFLASDFASYITGQMIAVDGGRMKSY